MFFFNRLVLILMDFIGRRNTPLVVQFLSLVCPTTDWNESSNLEGDGLSQYRYSKLMAERAAWEFVNSEVGKPRVRVCVFVCV